mmetsp:Transcript_10233/g.19173  ORF Transcript_10233/g.19173 Transcript_10233/m.19173 type:complete len:89 (+) Transcript_10233:1230-1496(+)
MIVLGCTEEDDLVSFDSLSVVDASFFTKEPAKTNTAAGRYATPNVRNAPKTGAKGAPGVKNAFRSIEVDPMMIPIKEPITGGLRNDLT